MALVSGPGDQEAHFRHMFASLALMQQHGVLCDITLCLEPPLAAQVATTANEQVTILLLPDSAIELETAAPLEKTAASVVVGMASSGEGMGPLMGVGTVDSVVGTDPSEEVGTAALVEGTTVSSVELGMVTRSSIDVASDVVGFRKGSQTQIISNGPPPSVIAVEAEKLHSYTHVHKAVLAACSRVLCSRLVADPGMSELPVTGLSVDTLATIIRYMYGGELTLQPETVDRMLSACQAWGMDSAVSICTRYKVKHMPRTGQLSERGERARGVNKRCRKRAAAVTVKHEPVKKADMGLHEYSPVDCRGDAKNVKKEGNSKGVVSESKAGLYGLRPRKRHRYGRATAVKKTAVPRVSSQVALDNVIVVKPQVAAGRGKAKPAATSQPHGYHAGYVDLSLFDEYAYRDADNVNVDEAGVQKEVTASVVGAADVVGEMAGTSTADESVVSPGATLTDADEQEMSKVAATTGNCETQDESKPSDAKPDCAPLTDTDCHKCGRSFATPQQYKRHRVVCTAGSQRAAKRAKQVKPFKCNQCAFRCQVETRLVEHMYRQHGFPLENAGFEVYVCQVGDCGYQSVLRNVMKHHQTKHSDERPYMCELCGSKFKSKVTLRTHIFMHTNQRRFKCTYCSNAYIQKVGLINHIKTKHEKSDEFLCSQCPFVTSLKPNLQNHMFSAHGVLQNSRSKVYECEHCGLKTLRKSEYKNHMQRHSGVKNFICAVCNHKFFTLAEINNHSKRHKESFNKHRCPHEGCSFSVFEKSKLTQHIRIRHTEKGEKPWLCYMCDYRTDLKGNLTKHLRTVHRLQVATNQRLCKVLGHTAPPPPPPVDVPQSGPVVNVNDLYLAKPPLPSPPPPPPPPIDPVGMSASKAFDSMPLTVELFMSGQAVVNPPVMPVVCDVSTAGLVSQAMTAAAMIAPPPPPHAISAVTDLTPTHAPLSLNTTPPPPTLTPLVTHLPPMTQLPQTYPDGQPVVPVMPAVFNGSEGNLYMYAGDGQIVPAQNIPWEQHAYDMAQYRQTYK